MTLRNQMESEAGSLHIHGASMIVSATGNRRPRRILNTSWLLGRRGISSGTSPKMQEGVRQFHSYSHDRELTVMGLFGAFIVEPKGSSYVDSLGTGPDKNARVAGR